MVAVDCVDELPAAGIQIDSADQAPEMLKLVTETVTEYRFLARGFKRAKDLGAAK